MNDMHDLPPDDPLLALLAAYAVTGSNIEHRVLAAFDQEQERQALRDEVAALRADVAALRAEMAELKRLLLVRREIRPVPTATLHTDDTRGKPLLPYARRDEAPSLFG